MLARLAFVPMEVIALLALRLARVRRRVRGSVLTLALVHSSGALSFAGLGPCSRAAPQTTRPCRASSTWRRCRCSCCPASFFSTSRFPDAMQPFIHALPLTALNDALRAVMNDGASLLAVGPQLLVLAVWGFVSFLVALRVFRWS